MEQLKGEQNVYLNTMDNEYNRNRISFSQTLANSSYSIMKHKIQHSSKKQHMFKKKVLHSRTKVHLHLHLHLPLSQPGVFPKEQTKLFQMNRTS